MEEEGLDPRVHITIYKNANFSQNLRCEINLAPRDQIGNQPLLFYKEILGIGEVTEMTKKRVL